MSVSGTRGLLRPQAAGFAPPIEDSNARGSRRFGPELCPVRFPPYGGKTDWSSRTCSGCSNSLLQFEATGATALSHWFLGRFVRTLSSICSSPAPVPDRYNWSVTSKTNWSNWSKLAISMAYTDTWLLFLSSRTLAGPGRGRGKAWECRGEGNQSASPHF